MTSSTENWKKKSEKMFLIILTDSSVNSLIGSGVTSFMINVNNSKNIDNFAFFHKLGNHLRKANEVTNIFSFFVFTNEILF